VTGMVMGVVMTGVSFPTWTAQISIVGGTVIVAIVLRLLACLSLTAFFAFYSLILEPYFDLTLSQI
jgi:hypothetical protein